MGTYYWQGDTGWDLIETAEAKIDLEPRKDPEANKHLQGNQVKDWTCLLCPC